jgi:hypothetical protein
MGLFSKDPCDRVDETLNQVLNGPLQVPVNLKKILKCVYNILREGDPGRTIKKKLGDQIGLGNYLGHSADQKKQRHFVRAVLLAECATGLQTDITGHHKAAIKGKTLQNLSTYAQNLNQNWGSRAKPTAIQTVSVATEVPQYGKGNIIHKFSWGSSTGKMHHLAYLPTRELVKYTRIRVGTNWYDIPMFGKEQWDKVDLLVDNPWHPEKTMSPDNPSCPGDVWNGPVGEGTDTHSQANIGPIVGAFLKDPEELVESEYWAVQEYQYNDTGDPDTWTRDYHKAPSSPPPRNYTVTVDHVNDHYWTKFDRGRWVLKRKIYKKTTDGQWYFVFTKEGFEQSNQGESYTTEVRVMDLTQQPLVVKKEKE